MANSLNTNTGDRVRIEDFSKLEFEIAQLLLQQGNAQALQRGARSAVQILVCLASDQNGSESEKFQSAIMSAFPARTFKIVIDQKKAKLEVYAELFLGEQHKGEVLGSELITVITPESQTDSIPSLIRGHGISGVWPTLVLGSNALKSRNFELFLPLCGKVLLDSDLLQYRVPILRTLLEHQQQKEITDLRWIALSPIRREIKNAFDNSQLLELLSGLQRIELLASDLSDSMSMWLLAGWIISSLGLEIRAVSAHGFECINKAQEKIFFEIRRSENPHIQSQLSFECAKDSIVVTSEGSCVSTQLKSDASWFLKGSLVTAKRKELLSSVATVGESVENYRPALASGLELLSLRQGFL